MTLIQTKDTIQLKKENIMVTIDIKRVLGLAANDMREIIYKYAVLFEENNTDKSMFALNAINNLYAFFLANSISEGDISEDDFFNEIMRNLRAAYEAHKQGHKLND